jgi:hypothetical protein
MTRRRSIPLAAIIILSAAGGAAAMTTSASPQFKVGRTGIHCYTQPCPWNGVWPADRAAQPENLVWSGSAPPPMTGDANDLARVRSDYLEGCTLVAGRFSKGVLAVDGVVGEC